MDTAERRGRRERRREQASQERGCEQAVRLARDELRTYADASMASEKLVETALKRHADDNVARRRASADLPSEGALRERGVSA